MTSGVDRVRPGSPGLERLVAVAVAVALGWFYLWTMRSSGEPWRFGEEQSDYYNLLVDGYLAGQLHMKVAVPPELAQLENPYDPAKRGGLGLHDTSFYRGKYYLYFGVGPIVTVMMPFRLV